MLLPYRLLSDRQTEPDWAVGACRAHSERVSVLRRLSEWAVGGVLVPASEVARIAVPPATGIGPRSQSSESHHPSCRTPAASLLTLRPDVDHPLLWLLASAAHQLLGVRPAGADVVGEVVNAVVELSKSNPSSDASS